MPQCSRLLALRRHRAVALWRCDRAMSGHINIAWGHMPPSRTKLSGAELAAQLGELSYPGTGSPARIDRPRDSTTATPAQSRAGRPSKAGADGVPVNVRLAQADHLALARIAAELMVPGRPMPTLQDIVRGLIRGALKDPEALKRLVREGRG